MPKLEKDTEKYIGKHLLAGISYYDSDNKLTKQIQCHGIITRITDRLIAFKNKDTQEEFTIPPDLRSIKPAPPGEYRLKGTGEVVINPDFLTQWSVNAPKKGK